jgi:hypothetical protein
MLWQYATEMGCTEQLTPPTTLAADTQVTLNKASKPATDKACSSSSDTACPGKIKKYTHPSKIRFQNVPQKMQPA